MTRRTFNVTLLVSESQRWPYAKARLSKSGSGARPGEITVPLAVSMGV